MVTAGKEGAGMRLATVLTALLIAVIPVLGEEGVFIPWNEFETLYRDYVEREIMKTAMEPRAEPQVYSIDEARYQCHVRPDGAEVDVLVSGRVISGPPEPIPLFGSDVVITSIDQVTGGAVITPSDLNVTAILPDGSGPAFQFIARLLVRAGEDGGAKSISFSIPRALQNTLEVSIPGELRLLDAQGIADGDGIYRFSASPSLSLRYADTQRLEAATVIQIDSLSRISAQRGRTFIATHFLPVRAVPDSLIIHVPSGAKYLSSSLRAASIRELDNGQYELTIPSEERGAFTIEWALDTPSDGGPVVLTLPVIEGNGGQQGRFILDEPEDGQIAAAADGLVSRIPAGRLPEPLRQAAAGVQFYMSVPAESPVTLTPTRFQPVSTPVTVLESQYFFSSFEENGNVLSVVVMDVPPDVGPRLELKAVPNAEIWSLTVNGVKKKVYGGDAGTWMIPLDAGQPSHVELAFLEEKEKLGLQGRLEASIPETGLPSQEVRIGIALPSRVELLSMEGPVSPAKGDEWTAPAEFAGNRYYFSRAFYKGEGMALAVSYKEPVDRTAGQGGPAR